MKHKQDLMDHIHNLKDDEKSYEEMIKNLKNDKDSLEKEANTNLVLVTIKKEASLV